MASRLISGMQLDASIANVLSARGIVTAKDALCKPELELMELLDLPLSLIKVATAQISLNACPPYRSVLTLMKERQNEFGFGHLRTHLSDIDSALHGGIPFGALTEVVGPAGFGKTQLCLMLCVITALPKEHGGLDGNVMYFDTERKFHSGRMAEIARSSLQGLEEVLIENQVKLLIIDSIAGLMQSEYAQEELSRKQNLLGHQAATLKYIAESFRIPIVVTNQVRMSASNRGFDMGFTFEAASASHNEEAGLTFQEDPELELTAALGTSWAHSVNIRLILESLSAGQRFVKIAKSPVSAVASYPYKVTSAGLELIGAEEYRTRDVVMTIHNDDFEAAESEDFEV